MGKIGNHIIEKYKRTYISISHLLSERTHISYQRVVYKLKATYKNNTIVGCALSKKVTVASSSHRRLGEICMTILT